MKMNHLHHKRVMVVDNRNQQVVVMVMVNMIICIRMLLYV